jgi:hypothetical protein
MDSIQSLFDTYLRPPMMLELDTSSGTRVKNSKTVKLIVFAGMPYACDPNCSCSTVVRMKFGHWFGTV